MEDKVELRSEKMRKIIGEIPPLLVRTGTAVILIIIALLAVAAYGLTMEGYPIAYWIFCIYP